MQVIKRKGVKMDSQKSGAIASVGISNNVGAERKAEFVLEALQENARRCRGIRGALKYWKA